MLSLIKIHDKGSRIIKLDTSDALDVHKEGSFGLAQATYHFQSVTLLTRATGSGGILLCHMTETTWTNTNDGSS